MEVHGFSIDTSPSRILRSARSCFQSIPNFPKAFSEDGFGDGLIVNLNALPDKTEMWRSIQPDTRGQPLSRDAVLCREILRENRGNESGRGSLALSSSNMDRV